MPESRDGPDARSIALPVVRLPATGPDPAEPAFGLEGGPGEPMAGAVVWDKASVGTPIAHGEGVDLALDSSNRPRLAFQMGGVGRDAEEGEGLGCAWCDANCGVTASWQARTLESSAAIVALYPPGLPAHQSCPILTWLNGVRPSLALDPAGNPRVGYDAELWWGGTSPYIQCNLAVPVARFGLFNK